MKKTPYAAVQRFLLYHQMGPFASKEHAILCTALELFDCGYSIEEIGQKLSHVKHRLIGPDFSEKEFDAALAQGLAVRKPKPPVST